MISQGPLSRLADCPLSAQTVFTALDSLLHLKAKKESFRGSCQQRGSRCWQCLGFAPDASRGLSLLAQSCP